jgi:putative ABC transport system permease protein
MYLSYVQEPRIFMTLVVRTSGDPSSLAAAVREQVRAIDKDQPMTVTTMERVLSTSVGRQRFNALLLGIFGSVALILAVVGVFGVINYSVAERTHEFGIRIALGAQTGDVLKLVLKQGIVLIVIGVAVGLAGALALTRVLATLLYEVSATDPATFAGISLLLIAVALLANYIPARRATKVDPVVALRCE